MRVGVSVGERFGVGVGVNVSGCDCWGGYGNVYGGGSGYGNVRVWKCEWV